MRSNLQGVSSVIVYFIHNNENNGRDIWMVYWYFHIEQTHTYKTVFYWLLIIKSNTNTQIQLLEVHITLEIEKTEF